MKKLIIAALFAGASFAASAACTVSSGTIAPQTTTPVACTIAPADSPQFIKVGFDMTPSVGSGLAYKEDTTSISVNAGNVKGKFTYGGSSTGGSVKQCAASATDVSTSTGYKAVPANATDGCTF